MRDGEQGKKALSLTVFTAWEVSRPWSRKGESRWSLGDSGIEEMGLSIWGARGQLENQEAEGGEERAEQRSVKSPRKYLAEDW